jgi:hypothetical protein
MDANVAVTQFTGAAVFVWGMQVLKSAKWFPLLKTEGQIWIKRVASVVAAICIHTGISHVWNPGTAPGSHVLIINIPPLMTMLVEVWHWVGQYAMQETIYQATGNRAAAAPAVKS